MEELLCPLFSFRQRVYIFGAPFDDCQSSPTSFHVSRLTHKTFKKLPIEIAYIKKVLQQPFGPIAGTERVLKLFPHDKQQDITPKSNVARLFFVRPKEKRMLKVHFVFGQKHSVASDVAASYTSLWFGGKYSYRGIYFGCRQQQRILIFH